MLSRIKKRFSTQKFDLSGKQLFTKLRIEINSDCTRKCKFCPRTFDPERKNIHKKMPEETVLSIIDQSIEMGFKGDVGFDFYNESTMDDRLLFFINYVRDKKLPVTLVTNGDLLMVKKKYAYELLHSSTNVFISLYDYEDLEGRNQLIEKWTKFINDLKIPITKVNFKGNYFEFGNRAGSIERCDLYNYKKELDDKVPIKAACKKFLSKLNIRYDGEVAICCEDALVKCSLGNVNRYSVSDIWLGERRLQIAKQLALGNREKVSPCNMCVKGILNV